MSANATPWDARQSQLLPTDRLRAAHVGVAGCGAVGRQLVLQLAAMGVGAISFADFDKIEVHNLASQGWGQHDLGRYKSDALAEQLVRDYPNTAVHNYVGRWEREGDLAGLDTVFACVDSMVARRAVWGHSEGAGLFVDARVVGEAIRVLAYRGEDQGYVDTLLTEDQTLRRTCTRQSTLYAANIAAGLMISCYSQYLRGVLTTPLDYLMGLGSWELFPRR